MRSLTLLAVAAAAAAQTSLYGAGVADWVEKT